MVFLQWRIAVQEGHNTASVVFLPKIYIILMLKFLNLIIAQYWVIHIIIILYISRERGSDKANATKFYQLVNLDKGYTRVLSTILATLSCFKLFQSKKFLGKSKLDPD